MSLSVSRPPTWTTDDPSGHHCHVTRIEEYERLLDALHAIAMEAQECEHSGQPIALGWLLTTCEEAIQRA